MRNANDVLPGVFLIIIFCSMFWLFTAIRNDIENKKYYAIQRKIQQDEFIELRKTLSKGL